MDCPSFTSTVIEGRKKSSVIQKKIVIVSDKTDSSAERRQKEKSSCNSLSFSDILSQLPTNKLHFPRKGKKEGTNKRTALLVELESATHRHFEIEDFLYGTSSERKKGRYERTNYVVCPRLDGGRVSQYLIPDSKVDKFS